MGKDTMSHINGNTSSGYIASALIFRAVGMALLTVPLATLAISSLEPKDMSQGAALNNMMRQLGGSFGISIVNTFMARRIAAHRIDLIAHVTPTNSIAMDRLDALTKKFQQLGYGLQDARLRGLQVMETVAQKQANIQVTLTAIC